MRHRKRPCVTCPWKVETESGEFTAERYDVLRETSGSAGREAAFGTPMFGCHDGAPGANEIDAACAGWLAVVGYDHLSVRLAVVSGALDPACLTPGDNWPELFGSYDEMAATQGRIA